MRHAQVEQRQFKELVAKVRSRYQISMRESVERSRSPQASAWGYGGASTQEPFQRFTWSV